MGRRSRRRRSRRVFRQSGRGRGREMRGNARQEESGAVVLRVDTVQEERSSTSVDQTLPLPL